MTLFDQLHNSKAHRDGFDPNCPKCMQTEGLDGIIKHLEKCASQNEKDGAVDVASEQWRMLRILKFHKKYGGQQVPQSL